MNKFLRAGLMAVAGIAVYAQFLPLVITTPSPLPFAVTGRSYNTPLSASGAAGGYTWSHESEGSPLPDGLSVDSGGAISGTVLATPGVYTFEVRVDSSNEDSTSKLFELSVYSRLVVTPSTLPDATRNSFYSTSVAATGGSSSTYTWSVVSGILPAGLILNPGTGQISGTPIGTATIYNFTVRAADLAGQQSDPQAFILRVREQALTINPPSTLPPGAVNVPYSSALSATGGNGIYTWSLVAGGTGLPSGVSLTSGGVVQGTPTASGAFAFRARVADSSTFQLQSQEADYSLVINPLLSITTTALPGGVIGSPYSAQLAATGGQQPYVWTLPNGTLPPGLTMTPGGLISGTPAGQSPSSITVRVTDSGVGQANQIRSSTVTISLVYPPLSVVTTSLAPAIFGEPYSQNLAATGGNPPYVWNLAAGNLPPGLTLNPAGSLSGTPGETGSFPITLRVRDSQTQPPFEATRSFTLVVSPGIPVITTSSLPAAQAQTPYSQSFTATGGSPPYTYTLASGSLPSGFVFTTTGQILGSAPDAASSSFNVRVTDQRGQTSEKSFTLTVSPRNTESGVEIVITNLPEGTVGRPYLTEVAARNGRAPYAWSISGLPPGLTANSRGEISGTPTRDGRFTLQATVNDDNGGRAVGGLTLVIRPGSVIITTERVPEGRVAEAYSAQLAATGGVAPYVFTSASGSLPPGLTLNPAGLLSGTPAQAGTFAFVVLATDANSQRGTRDFSLVIGPARLAVTTSSLAVGSVNVAYSASLAATGGRAPYRWSVTGLPEGLTLNASTGAIAGTPTRTGSFPLAVQVTDQDNQTATTNLTVEINAGLTITTQSVGDFVVGTPVSTSLGAAGGRAPYTWSVTGGSLPAGLALSGDGGVTGTPTGTPTGTGAYSFTAQVRDQNSQTATRTFTGSVQTALTVTTQSAPAGAVGVPYTLTVAATGGTPPYRWSSAGTLPAGLTATADGTITGTPTAAGTFEITAIVTDSATPAQTARRVFPVTIALPQLSGVTIVLPANLQPQQQPNVGVTIDQPFPAAIAGTLTLTFTPDTANNADDPFIQFSTGGRSVPFTIPMGQTQGVFSGANVAIQTGTTAGTITITTNLAAGGNAINCNCPLTRTIVIPRGAPVITNVRGTRNATGFTVTVTGFSTSREVTQAIVRFAGDNLQTTEVTVPLTTVFNSWFQGASSQQFGGQFTLNIPFTTQGESSSVTGVTVTLTNAAGNSQPATANF